MVRQMVTAEVFSLAVEIDIRGGNASELGK
jgi:hypothetical protein